MTAPAELQLASLEKFGKAIGMDVPEYVVPSSRHIVAGNHRVHVLDWGTEGKPHVVFLHGMGLTAHTWSMVCLALRQDYHCHAVDLRGHGESEWSPVLDYGAEAHARDVAGVVDAVSPDGPVVLVGMSLGGITALTYAVDHVERLRGLVIVDIAPPVDTEERPKGPEARPIQAQAEGPSLADTVDEFIDHALVMNPRRDRETLRVSMLNNLRQTPEGKWTWKNDRRPYERMLAMMKEAAEAAEAAKAEGDTTTPTTPNMPNPFSALAEKLATMTVPVRLVRGGDSMVVSSAAAEAFAAQLPTATLVEVPKAGHTVQGDNPPGFVEAVRPFLDSLA